MIGLDGEIRQRKRRERREVKKEKGRRGSELREEEIEKIDPRVRKRRTREAAAVVEVEGWRRRLEGVVAEEGVEGNGEEG